MKVFNIVDEFNQINISGQRHINNLIEKIKNAGIGNDLEIELNLEDCQTDYPETPKLVDYFLNHLSSLTGNKVLTIKFNGLGTKEIYILYDIILEGEYFGIHEKIDSEEELSKWKLQINSKLRENNICMEIRYTTENTTFTYGQNDFNVNN